MNKIHAAKQKPKTWGIRLYFSHHKHALQYGFRQLTKNPWASLLTIATVSITIVLPIGLFLILSNMKIVTKNWQSVTSISIYLSVQTTKQQTDYIQRALQKIPNIKHVHYISPEQGLQQFAKRSGLNNILNTLGKNPLPGVFTIEPNSMSPAQLNILISQLQALPNVASVKLDMQWVKRLINIIALLQRFTYGLAIILALAVLLIIGNTIRMAIQNYHYEIDVLKLIGASNRFIRRPFLYSGIFYGIASAIFAAVILDFFLLWLQGPLNRLAKLYNTQFLLQGLNLQQISWLLLISIFLGFLGSWLVVNRQLKTLG